jgi:hypothetical protein
MPHYNVNPFDGMLSVVGFEACPHHEEAWKVERERFQRIRGETLSAVFEVESSIDYAIADCLLPRKTIRSPAALVKKHLLMQNELLIHFNFNRKIEVVGSLLNHRFPKKETDIRRLLSLLNRVREVRNRMAHAPVFFEALEKKVSGSWLRPYLMTPRGNIHVSDAYLRNFRKDAIEATDLLRKIMKLGIRLRPDEIEPVW